MADRRAEARARAACAFSAAPDTFTDRELALLRRRSQGWSLRKVADMLSISAQHAGQIEKNALRRYRLASTPESFYHLERFG